MKINPLLHSLSITKVISTVTMLILIISGTHLFIYLTNNHSQNHNNIAINKLINLREHAKYFIKSEDLNQERLKFILSTFSPEKHNLLLDNKFFDVKHIYDANLDLQLTINKMIDSAGEIPESQLILGIQKLRNTSLYIIKQYRILSSQESLVIFISQITTSTLIISLLLFLLFYCRRYITAPLNQLEENVFYISNHQFNVEFIEGDNEIGMLSTHLKSMSAELESLISAMQHKVFEKRTQLVMANSNIQFLFEISKKLNVVKLTPTIMTEALNLLAKQTNLSKLCLTLTNGTLIVSRYGCAKDEANKSQMPIVMGEKPYGYLNYIHASTGADNVSIIASFSNLLARALYQQEYSLQEQKLLLVEERGVIARELHDSIAQALSFLKIQCTVLNRQIDSDQYANNKEVKESVANIKEAVNGAYVQLRSLLSTFRLNISISDFKEAVLVMVSQLQKQTTANIKLGEFDANFQALANQHVHLLQIIREATINAMKHANCNNIRIDCSLADNEVCISITDDGIGISNSPNKDNHYGVEIMNQRAAELNASIEISGTENGTQVALIFKI